MHHEASRHRLIALLTEACELEQALACSYLYAAFSIKRDLDDDVDYRAQNHLRRWQSEIYHVAAQEMLHLAQAWNLLTAVGGTPYYYKPDYPMPARHYPLNVAIILRRFDLATMDRFVYYETPSHEDPSAPEADAAPHFLWPTDETFAYRSVGELYAECANIVAALDENVLFVGDSDSQVGRDLIDFPDIVRVTDRASARAAIDQIVRQGEGTRADHADSHFGVFLRIRKQLAEAEMQCSWPVGDNPFVPGRRDQLSTPTHQALRTSALTTTAVTDMVSQAALDLFDDAYVVMFQGLHYVFVNAAEQKEGARRFAQVALQYMVTVLKPLGEAICRMPSGTTGINAGPSFALTRHVPLPAPPRVAARVYGERLEQLSRRAKALAREVGDADPVGSAQVHSAAANIARIESTFVGR